MNGAPLRVWFGLAAVLAASVPACTCDVVGIEPSEPHLQIAESLSFPDAPLGLGTQASVQVRNDGTDVLLLKEVSVTAGAQVFTVDAASDRVLPGASLTLTLHFNPLQEGPATGALSVRTNAIVQPDREVALTGTGLPSVLEVAPLTLDFGTLTPGQQDLQQITLTNTSDQLIRVTAAVTADLTLAFAIDGAGVGNPTTVTLQALESRSVGVWFAPTVGGRATATARFDYCGSGCGVGVPVVGQLTAPRLDVDPLLVDFGRSELMISVARVATLYNRGSAPMDVTGATLEQSEVAFSADLSGLPVTLDPGAQTTLDLTYLAPRAGRSDAVLRLTTTDPRTPTAQIMLTGTTGGSDLAVTPLAINFGTVYQDGLFSRDVLLLNRGDQPASLQSLGVTGEGFALAAQPALPFALQPASSMVLSVVFSPVAMGTYNGVLQLTSDSPGREAVSVTLEGLRATRACQVEASTAELSFGAVRVGQQSQRFFTVRNTGTGACQLTAPILSASFANSPGFSVQGQAVTLQPGDAQAVTVRYSPAGGGFARAVVQINVVGHPQVLVTARGNGTTAGLSANPAFVDFGAVPLGCGAATRTVSLLSDGASPVTVEAPTVYTPPAFTAVATGFPVQIGPGLSREVTVSFLPQQLAEATGEMVLVGFSGGQPVLEVRVALRGEGVAASQPASETFVVPATPAMDVLVVVDNSGSMFDNQDRLATNAQSFMAVADFGASSVDYHMAVLTTDVESPEDAGNLRGTPRVMDRATAPSQFPARARVGVDGSPYEQGLEAVRLALSPPLVTGANAGFLRDEAGLAIIVVSDEDDGGPLSVDSYLNFLRGLKAASGASVVVCAITGQVAGCRDNASGDTASPAQRYEYAVDQTGGISASICDPDWGTKLQRVGEAALLAGRRFTLTGRPDPATITVDVNNTPRTTGWSYDAAANQVRFTSEAGLQPGQTVVVHYVSNC